MSKSSNPLIRTAAIAAALLATVAGCPGESTDAFVIRGQLIGHGTINPGGTAVFVTRTEVNAAGAVTVDQRQVNLLLTPLGRRRMLQIREDAEEQDRVLSALLEAEGGEMLKQLLFKLA